MDQPSNGINTVAYPDLCRYTNGSLYNQYNSTNPSTSTSLTSPINTIDTTSKHYQHHSTLKNAGFKTDFNNEEDDIDDEDDNEDDDDEIENTNNKINEDTNTISRKPTNSYESASSDSTDHVDTSSSFSPVSSPLNNNFTENENNQAQNEIETNCIKKESPFIQSRSTSTVSSPSYAASETVKHDNDVTVEEEKTKDEDEEPKNSLDNIKEKMSLNAEKALDEFFNEKTQSKRCLEEDLVDEEKIPPKKICLESIQKLSATDLAKLKHDLTNAVGQAIQSTLENFYSTALFDSSNNEKSSLSTSSSSNSSASLSPNQQVVVKNESIKSQTDIKPQPVNSSQQQQAKKHQYHKSKIRIHEKSNRQSFKSAFNANSQAHHTNQSYNVLKMLEKNTNNNKIYDLQKERIRVNSHNHQQHLPLPGKSNNIFNPMQAKPSPQTNNHHLPSIQSNTKSNSPASIPTNGSNDNLLSAFSASNGVNKSLLTTTQAQNQSSNQIKQNQSVSAAVNQFYNAAMSHLHQQQHNSNLFNHHHHHHHPFVNSNAGSSGSMSSASSSSSTSASVPPTPQTNPQLTPPFGQTPLSAAAAAAAHHHQFLLSAAAAASSLNGHSNPNFNLHMAAAANRLFTPYLLDPHASSATSTVAPSLSLPPPSANHHHHHMQSLPSPIITTANKGLLNNNNLNPKSTSSNTTSNSSSSSSTSSSGSAGSHHLSNNILHRSSNGSLFHTPGKRRRTKVTDTRLSPRNTALRTGGLLGLNGGVSNLIHSESTSSNTNQSPIISSLYTSSFKTTHQNNNGNKSQSSPLASTLNNNENSDDQENYIQDSYNDDYQDEENQLMREAAEAAAGVTHHRRDNDDDDEDIGIDDDDNDINDDAMSCNNESNKLTTMPNGCYSSGSGNMFFNENNSNPNNNNANINNDMDSSSNEYHGYQTATLSSLHLRKAKLMFFFTRYPSSTILRNFFPDVKFNKANTAQLVKWFSNFREFFYIQMEKYARQHIAEGIRNAEELHVDIDSEIYRALNSHYNRNNQLEVPPSFCYVIEATLREFFKAIQESKDLDPSWKKAIYKIIARMDDTIPEFFKSIKWMETLESNI